MCQFSRIAVTNLNEHFRDQSPSPNEGGETEREGVCMHMGDYESRARPKS